LRTRKNGPAKARRTTRKKQQKIERARQPFEPTNYTFADRRHKNNSNSAAIVSRQHPSLPLFALDIPIPQIPCSLNKLNFPNQQIFADTLPPSLLPSDITGRPTSWLTVRRGGFKKRPPQTKHPLLHPSSSSSSWAPNNQTSLRLKGLARWILGDIQRPFKNNRQQNSCFLPFRPRFDWAPNNQTSLRLTGLAWWNIEKTFNISTKQLQPTSRLLLPRPRFDWAPDNRPSNTG
jgi:hypothetical protein